MMENTKETNIDATGANRSAGEHDVRSPLWSLTGALDDLCGDMALCRVVVVALAGEPCRHPPTDNVWPGLRRMVERMEAALNALAVTSADIADDTGAPTDGVRP